MSGMKRREFIRAGALAAGAAALGVGGAGTLRAQADGHHPTLAPLAAIPATGGDKRPPKGGAPNILWIMTDEQRPDSLGCYGSAWARTPNLDRLARQGAVFTECHVQSPACVPSRTSQLFCRYPQEVGVLDNKYFFEKGILDPALVSFPQIFSQAGYRTATLGKWHTPDHPIWNEARLIQNLDTINPYELKDKSQEESCRIVHRPKGTPIILGGIYPEDEYWGTDMASNLTDISVDWLQQAAAEERPFFLRVSYLWPHTPAVVPRPWHLLYDPKQVKVPIDHREEMYANRSKLDQALADQQGGNEMDRATWEWVCATYYACCAYVDHQLGRLLYELDRLGLADNTIIVFSSDHGRNNGEYGAAEKGTFDREVWRVPLIFHAPGRIEPGQVRGDLCEALDLGPTLLALAGLKPAVGMRGRDLFHSEEPDAVYGMLNSGGPRVPENPHAPENQGQLRLAIRTRRWRYDIAAFQQGKPLPPTQQHPSLYDIQNDPEERYNLIEKPEHAAVAAELNKKLLDWFASLPMRQA